MGEDVDEARANAMRKGLHKLVLSGPFGGMAVMGQVAGLSSKIIHYTVITVIILVNNVYE